MLKGNKTVLLLAYSCKPNSGGEPGAGWGYLNLCLEAGFRVILITQEKNRVPILNSLPIEKIDMLQVVTKPHSRLMTWFKHNIPWGTQIAYLVWTIKIISKAREIEKQQVPHFAWHVTFASDSLPSALIWLKSTPLILGPVGGYYKFNFRDLYFYGVLGGFSELFRIITTNIIRRIFINRTIRKSILILALNNDVADFFKRYHNSVIIEPNVFESSILKTFIELTTNKKPIMKSNINIVGIGRLIPLKGWSLGIRALAGFPENSTLTIYGSGRDLKRLKRIAKRSGFQQRVIFDTNWYKQEDLFRIMSKADVVIFPSFHDSCGWVMWEALKIGVPVVHLDVVGPGTLCKLLGVMHNSRSKKAQRQLSPSELIKRFSLDVKTAIQSKQFRAKQDLDINRLRKVLDHADF